MSAIKLSSRSQLYMTVEPALYTVTHLRTTHSALVNIHIRIPTTRYCDVSLLSQSSKFDVDGVKQFLSTL